MIKTLQVLSLRDCELTDGAMEDVVVVIRAHAARRDDLRWVSGLRQPHVQANAALEAEEVPSSCAVQLQGLLSVDLSKNRIGANGMKALCRALTHDSWLAALNLSVSPLSHGSAAPFTVAIIPLLLHQLPFLKSCAGKFWV